MVAQAGAKYDYDLVIIGCGVGGHGAALHAVEQVRCRAAGLVSQLAVAVTWEFFVKCKARQRQQDWWHNTTVPPPVTAPRECIIHLVQAQKRILPSYIMIDWNRVSVCDCLRCALAGHESCSDRGP